MSYQVAKKSLNHCQPQVEIRQILFDASRETVSIYGWLLGLVLCNLPCSKAAVTSLKTSSPNACFR